MPTPIAAPSPAASLFSGSLFGQTAEAQPGLFSLLLGILGEAPVEGAATLQQAPQGGLFALLPENPAQPAPTTLEDLISLLDQTGETPELVNFLKSFEGGEIAPDAVKAKFAGLDDDTQTKLLDEVQTLVTALAPPPPAPIVEAAVEEKDEETAVDAPTDVSFDIADVASAPTPDDLPFDFSPLPPVAHPAQKKADDTVSSGQSETADRTQPLAGLVSQPAEKAGRMAAKPNPQIEIPADAPAASTKAAGTEAVTAAAALSHLAKTLKEAMVEARTTKPATPTKATAPAEAKPELATPIVEAPKLAATPTATEKPAVEAKLAPVGTDKPAPDLAEAPQPQPAVIDRPAKAEAAKPQDFASQLHAIKSTHGAPHTPVAEQVSVQIAKAAEKGEDRITIRLQPPELGRIEVKLDLSNANQITAKISADNPVTLDLMKRDSSSLQQALTDAGFKTDGASLSFNLRGDGQQNFAGRNDGQGQPHANAHNTPVAVDEDMLPGAMQMTWFVSPDHVDMRI